MGTLAEASLRSQRKRAERKEGARTRAEWKGWGDGQKEKAKKIQSSSVPRPSYAVVLELPQAKNILSLKVLTSPCVPPTLQLSISPLSNVTPALLPLLLQVPAFTVTTKLAPSSPPASCPGLTQVGNAGERVCAHAFLWLKRKTERWPNMDRGM